MSTSSESRDRGMLDNEGGALWRAEAQGYAVVAAGEATATRERSGLSHTAAMRIADELRRNGRVATVVHQVGDRSYEVDCFPVR